MPSKKRASSRSKNKGTSFLVALQVVTVMIPLIATRLHTRAEQIPPPGNNQDFVDTNGNDIAHTDGVGAYFNHAVNDARSQWEWSPATGWTLETNAETYQNGWAWVWSEPDGWTWQQTSSASAMTVDEAVNIRAQAAIEERTAVASSEASLQGCLSDNGSWTTNRDGCGTDQTIVEPTEDDMDAPKAPMQKILPEDIRSAVEDARPLTPAEEREVSILLQDRFAGADVVAAIEPVVSHTASDIIRKLSVLKDNAKTSEARDYVIAKIAAAQDLSKHLADAETKGDVDAVTNELKSIAMDTEMYVKENGITVKVDPAAPTGMELLNASERLLRRMPKVFAVLTENNMPTETLEKMYAETLKTLDKVRIDCETQSRCGGVRDVIEQIEQIVSAVKGLGDASRDSKLQYQLEQVFQLAD